VLARKKKSIQKNKWQKDGAFFAQNKKKREMFNIEFPILNLKIHYCQREMGCELRAASLES